MTESQYNFLVRPKSKGFVGWCSRNMTGNRYINAISLSLMLTLFTLMLIMVANMEVSANGLRACAGCIIP